MHIAEIIFSIVFFVIVVSMWLALVGYTVMTLVKWHKWRRSPVETVEAEVLSCEEVEDFIFNQGKRVVANHNVRFSAKDGRQFVFSLKPSDYKKFYAGDAGLLSLRDGEFARFESLTATGQRMHASGTNADQVYDQLVKGK